VTTPADRATYAIFNQSAGGTIDIFHQVVDLLPDQAPEGLLLQVAGQAARQPTAVVQTPSAGSILEPDAWAHGNRRRAERTPGCT
jgi:hypothetical protein